MRRHVVGVSACFAVLLASAAFAGQRGGVKAQPPVVVKTVPQSGDTEVDPGLAEIQVTFSKDMKTEKNWSFVQVSKDSYPKTTGEPRYIDKRTIVLPVALEPGKTYIIWLNQKKFTGFRDLENYPAVPYLLVFETREAPAAPAAP